ncbi:EAL domain-containing protein [Solirubrobacter phytolaccae]|uniref:EAL domain-containing protein n=1 Tax=Solirubrobacter phytolaccae TaxID=1404360 RepID=A0A9X3N900_9ACTN|nr:EAL domain-containing protein [Solirubrobacter phytolaccae]MDA0179801.1 EAL domain-containing protein [Solirubrobacter phytolaccae]
MFSAGPTPCLVLDADFCICEVNDTYLAMTRRRREDLLGINLFDAFPGNPDDPEAKGQRDLRASLQRVLRTGRADTMPTLRYDLAQPTADGMVFEERWWRPNNTPVLGADGRVVLIKNCVEDVTATQRARRERERSERRLRSLVEHAMDAILVIGLEREVTYASPATSRFIGRRIAELDDFRWDTFIHPEDLPAALELLDAVEAVARGETVSGQLRVVRADGSVRFTEVRATNHRADEAINGVVLNVRDVTEQRQVERLLQQQALEDVLTATPNRRWFVEAAKSATARSARTGHPVGVVLVDVDHFKQINDTMGHPAGDRLLIELVRRMASALRPSDTVARLGGDEFAILSEDLRSEQDAWQIAHRIAAAATGSYELGPGLEARVTLSIGVSTDEGGADADTLIAHADAALYKAKRAGRNRIEVFDPELRRALVDRTRTEQELRRALDGDELVLHWQPIVRTSDGVFAGAEALLRWQHPDRGLLVPAAFLPVAEEAGLMHRVGAWAIERALEQAVAWQRLEHPPRVFVNLAAEQLRDPLLPDAVSRLAGVHGVRPDGVCFEVSERVLAVDVAAIRAQLLVLRDRGFGLALDDFGAGNTALTWLQQLPLDVLKLDRSFAATATDPTAHAIISAVVQLAPTLGMTSIAEGVETAEQLATLRGLGCDFAQGYTIAEPQAEPAVTPRFQRPLSAL